MRIALSGAHATGKSTLATELVIALPGHELVEEPFYQLEAEGHVFAARPALEDYEAQLERSLRDVAAPRDAVVLDRSPADYLAYMLAKSAQDSATSARWFPEVRDAMVTLDLVVFVPVQRPDRITAPEASRLRRRVDATLRAGLVADEWGLGAAVLEVQGSVHERVQQVLARLASLEPASHPRGAP